MENFWVYVNFRDLNVATPKDMYGMLIADMLVDLLLIMNCCPLWMVSLVTIRF